MINGRSRLASARGRHRRRWFAALAVLLLALAFRLVIWGAGLDRPDAFWQPDTPSYLETGRKLLAEGVFPSFLRTPVYPFFLALTSELLGDDMAKVALVQVGLATVTVLFVGLLCLRPIGVRASLLAMFFLALDLASAISASQLLTETFFTCLFVASMAILVGRRGGGGLLGAALAGLGVAALTLCRPIAFLLFAIVAIWLMRVAPRPDRRAARRLTAVFVILALLPPLGWVMRNHAHTGKFFLSTISACNLYECRAAANLAHLSQRPLPEVQAQLLRQIERQRTEFGMNEGELAEWEGREGVKILLATPMLTLRQGLAGAFRMYCGVSAAAIDLMTDGRGWPRWLPNGIKLAAALHLALMYGGVILAGVALARGRLSTRTKTCLWLMLMLTAYFTLFSIGVEAYSRFRVPIAPTLSILAGIGWATWWGRWSRSRLPTA